MNKPTAKFLAGTTLLIIAVFGPVYGAAAGWMGFFGVLLLMDI
jgi:hypothetical protein